jgi:hypothetical protein
MWVFRYIRWWESGERWSMRSWLLLPVTVPILITQMALLILVLAAVVSIVIRSTSASNCGSSLEYRHRPTRGGGRW